MNPNLLHAVRERMREQSTEQLLALWVTNDRATYSPEAFEAVRSLLAERGVTTLPPQSDPAPIAEKHSPDADPAVQYWLGWLKPVLWIGIAIAALNLVQVGVSCLVVWDDLRLAEAMRTPWATSTGLVRTVVLPVWLLAGSVACIRVVPVGRRLLLLYAFLALVVGAAAAVADWWRRWAYYDGRETLVSWELAYALDALLGYAHSLLLPVILLIFLRRPEIRSVFVAAGPAGFDLSLMGKSPPTAPAETPPNPASPAGSSSPAGQC